MANFFLGAALLAADFIVVLLDLPVKALLVLSSVVREIRKLVVRQRGLVLRGLACRDSFRLQLLELGLLLRVSGKCWEACRPALNSISERDDLGEHLLYVWAYLVQSAVHAVSTPNDGTGNRIYSASQTAEVHRTGESATTLPYRRRRTQGRHVEPHAGCDGSFLNVHKGLYVSERGLLHEFLV